ncbi:hypothetical protein AUP74_00204 [Microbulbifer aggregans]|uniref:Uncharacterized protein n=1 Tax=Microbulbifer aggregans TaxID=1769779 RepID=A0A1C9W3D8_9GAMM|nr:hypothetical protein AUP74_00204 [Microbulbifer aggregans]
MELIQISHSRFYERVGGRSGVRKGGAAKTELVINIYVFLNLGAIVSPGEADAE